VLWLLLLLLLLLLLSAPLLGLGRFSSFLILYTFGRTPWTGDQLVTRSLSVHRINAHVHPCLEWHSNPGHQCSSGWRQFMPLPRGTVIRECPGYLCALREQWVVPNVKRALIWNVQLNHLLF
jgi:hypothetical protein